jgi:hypothetical protein
MEMKHGKEICLAFIKQKSILIIRTEAVPIPQRIERVSTRKNKRLIFREIITVPVVTQSTHTHTVLNAKPGCAVTNEH